MFDDSDLLYIIESLSDEFTDDDLLFEANDRSKVVDKLKGKEEARKPKFFSYKGDKASYMAGAKRVLSDRKYRTLLRSAKKKPHEYDDATLSRLHAGYDVNTGTIAVNKKQISNLKSAYGGHKRFSIKPMLKHEVEHHEQTMRAKDLGGTQNARRLASKYGSQVLRLTRKGKKVLDTNKYANHPMERGANVAAMNGANSEDRDKAVKQTIGYKRNKNKVFKTKYNDGRIQFNKLINSCVKPKKKS